MTVLGSAYMEIIPETEGFASKLQSMLGSIPLAGAVAAAAVGIGVALLDIGEKFEGMNNTIIQKTGASGTALKGLEQSAKDVFSSTLGATFSNVGDTISELSVRTGLAGKALDSYASKEIELGKITKTDVGANVQATTALFNLFGVAAKNQSGDLDVLFKASQVAGVSITDLTSGMQAAGPMAMSLGLNVNQTAALVANLAPTGVSATKVMAGLGTEFAKAAKAGKDPISVINDMVATLKAAPSQTDAARIAVSQFGIGAKQAGLLAAQARDGVFNLGATMAKISGPGGGIVATANATATIGDKFKLLKNQAETELEPIASKFLDFANMLVGKIGPAVSALAGFIGPIFKTIQGYISDFIDGFKTGDSASSLGLHGFIGTLVNLGGTVAQIFGDIKQAVSVFISGFSGQAIPTSGWLHDIGVIGQIAKEVFGWIRDNIKPILIGVGAAFLLITSPVTAVIAALVILYVKFQVVRDIVADVADFFINDLVPAVASFVSFAIKAIEPLVEAISSRFGEIETVIKGVLIAIAIPFVVTFKVLEGIWSVFHATILRILIAVWDEIKLVITTAINIISDVIKLVLDVLTGHWSKAWDDVLNILQNIWNLIGGTISNALSIVGNLIGSLGGIFLRAMGGALSAVVNTGANILLWFVNLPGLILDKLVGIGSWLLNAGIQLIQGLINGIGNMAQAAGNAVVNVAKGAVKAGLSILGIHSPSTVFQQMGVNVVEGFALGLGQTGAVSAAMNKLAGLTTGAALPNLSGASGGSNAAGAAAGGLSGGAGSGGGSAPVIHIYPARGMSEPMIGRTAANEISWQSKTLRTGNR
jgi:phage-related minor tail protein